MQLVDAGGAARLSFEPPWTRTTSLPPFPGTETALVFAREATAGTNTFLLPLGHRAADFRQQETLLVSDDALPRFRDGANLAPARRPNAPSWLRSAGPGVRAALEPNRMLSRIRMTVLPRGVPLARGLAVTLTMIRDLPTPLALLMALGVAWILLLLFVVSIGFGQTHRLRLRDLWCIGGIVVAVWTILLFRVLLAVRYLLTPTAVDEVTVKGLAGTLAALVIVPGFIALAIRLWLHHRPGIPSEARSAIMTTIVAVALFAGTAVELLVVPRYVLPNVATRMPVTKSDLLLLVVVLAAAGISIVTTARDEWRPARWAAALWELPYRAVFEAGRTFWQTFDAGEEHGAAPHWLAPVKRIATTLGSPVIRPMLIGWGVVSVVILILSLRAPEIVRQIVAPFWIIGMPALVLLARPLAPTDELFSFEEQGTAVEPRWAHTVAVVVLLAFLPALVTLGALSDFGAIYAVLAFLFPLALLLSLTSATRTAATLLIVLVLGVALAYWALLGTYAIAPGMTEHILSRVEVMKHGSSAQEWLLDLEGPTAADAKTVTAANVRNAMVHEWEHMAMARKGGWLGLGFHRAPASQSFIRQDTIQYDSVFSFFVLGEYGLLGGLILLGIFAAPALLLLMRRTKLRTGDVLAAIIAVAFLGEAAAHAAMNVAQLWFSGRNLPLLATSSNSDVLRWALLLGLMCQALLWSSRLDAESYDAAPDTTVTRPTIFDMTFDNRPLRFWSRTVAIAVVVIGIIVTLVTRDFAWLAFACAIPLAMTLSRREYPALALLPVLLVIVFVVRGSLRAFRSTEYDVFTWSRLLKRVDDLSDDGTLSFDPRSKRILFRSGDGPPTDHPTGATLLESEVLRFNSLPERLRLDGGRESLPPSFFSGVADPGTYYAKMFELWRAATEQQARLRPSVFTIERVDTEGEGAPEVGYAVRGNPDFNVSHSFSEDWKENELAPVSVRGSTGRIPLLGRAWVMGRWTYAPTDEGRSLGLSWSRQLGESLMHLPRERRARLAELTIDGDLQRIVQASTDDAGRTLHGRLIAEGAPAPLPPRVAFAIMRATTGEMLAMGAWPRAAAGNGWKSRRVGSTARGWTELDPPADWVSTSAPRALASRHGGDHNFAAIEMGSAAKPFWATATLSIHPFLRRALLVRNGDCDAVSNGRCYERNVFGVEIGKGWQVSPVRRWVDFDTYLAASDNRYHTRLGFLALARARGEAIADDGRGRSRSGRESLSGQTTPWDRYPALSEATGHTRDDARTLRNLQELPLAARMRDLFGARVGAPPREGPLRRHLLSFWSADEQDDLASSRSLEALTDVSPDAVDLRLNRITSTRDYLTVLLGGGSSRWSNVAAEAAFSSWALRRPVVAHIAGRAPSPLASRKAAFDAPAVAAAKMLETGLRRVIDDGTALGIRAQLQPLRDRYEVYAKTGTLAATDPERPTSRILLIIIARDSRGEVRNALTLSFVAERATMGFATAEVGRFVDQHREDLVRLMESP
ncbi:MAG TPA: hypothetical protein VJ276_09695, partial [Thermoanaerobaculia bacterium]|nr:hypothetical protein [Thermoanaerobaculia bacterium]